MPAECPNPPFMTPRCGWKRRFTTLKVRIYPNEAPAERIEKTFGCCRHIWNRMLADQQRLYIEANACNSALLDSFDESFCIFEMPFLFGDSYESMENLAVFCRTPEFKELVAVPVEAKGIKVYPTYLDGAREISTTKTPVKSLDDLKGLKLRSTGGRFSESTGQTYGFNTMAIAAAELPTALMQGTVDGQMMNPVYVYQVKSPVSYYTIIPFDYTAVDPINVSASFYNSLPADLRELMDQVGTELFDYSVQYTTELLDEGDSLEAG